MKKSVIIAILIIYLASILVVNFFGLQLVIPQATVYVESIQVNGISVERSVGSLETWNEVNTEGMTTYYFKYLSLGENDSAENVNAVVIDYTALPDNATNKAVEIICTSTNVQVIENKIIFLRAGRVQVQLRAKDGSLKTADFMIFAQR